MNATQIHIVSVSQGAPGLPVLSRCTCGWQGLPADPCHRGDFADEAAQRRAEGRARQHAYETAGRVAWPED